MGSSQIYTQKMFADLSVLLTAVQGDMTALEASVSADLASMLLKIDTQITSLGNVVAAVNNNVSELYCVASDTSKCLHAGTATIGSTSLTDSTYAPMTGARFIAKCTGTAKLKFNARTETISGSVTARIVLYINGVVQPAYILNSNDSPTDYVAREMTFNIFKDDIIGFGIRGGSSSAYNYTGDIKDINLCYDIINMSAGSGAI